MDIPILCMYHLNRQLCCHISSSANLFTISHSKDVLIFSICYYSGTPILRHLRFWAKITYETGKRKIGVQGEGAENLWLRVGPTTDITVLEQVMQFRGCLKFSSNLWNKNYGLVSPYTWGVVQNDLFAYKSQRLLMRACIYIEN